MKYFMQFTKSSFQKQISLENVIFSDSIVKIADHMKITARFLFYFPFCEFDRIINDHIQPI